MSVVGENRNRYHAIKQLSKGVKKEDELDVFSAIANAIIYVGDELRSLNGVFESQEERIEIREAV